MIVKAAVEDIGFAGLVPESRIIERIVEL